MLQGVTMLHSEAMPTTGFLKSSSVNPTGRSIERAPARLGPSVSTEENLRRESDEEELMEGRVGARSRPNAAGPSKRVCGLRPQWPPLFFATGEKTSGLRGPERGAFTRSTLPAWRST